MEAELNPCQRKSQRAVCAYVKLKNYYRIFVLNR